MIAMALANARTCSSPTSRPPRSTSPCRRRSSSSSKTCRRGSAWRSCLSPTTSTSSAGSPTGCCVMRAGEIVEASERRRAVHQPHQPYTRATPRSGARRAIHRPPDMTAPKVMRAMNLRVWFPLRKRGCVRAVRRLRQSGRRRFVTNVREGQTARRRGRSGSGKTTLGLAILRLFPARADVDRGPADRRDCTSNAMRRADPDADRLPGPIRLALAGMSVGEIVEEGLVVHGLANERAERRRVARCASARRIGLIPRPRPLSARVLRRPAPTHRHRPRDGVATASVVLDEPTSAFDMSDPGADRRSIARIAAPSQPHRLPRSFPTISGSCGRWRAKSS